MRFVIALVLSFALVWLCAKPLKKYPVPFYLGAIVLVGLYFWGSATGVRGEAWSVFQPLMQRCALAFLLFSIVMFVGVLGERNPLRAHLMHIRRQLSILACIFAVGHIAFYAHPTCRGSRAPSPATSPSPWGWRRSSPLLWRYCGLPRRSG